MKDLFLTSKKGQGTVLTSKKKGGYVQHPHKSVNMNDIKFCEESVFLMMNFVKCPKTGSISTIDRPLNLKQKICLNILKKKNLLKYN